MADEQEPDRHGIDADEELRELEAQPSVDGLLDQLSTMMQGSDGWAGIDTSGRALHRQRQESAAAIKREANIFRDTFATDAGRRCLQLMIDQTINAAPYPIDAMLTMEAITPLVIAHDAQCNFVRAILQAIATAENRQPKART